MTEVFDSPTAWVAAHIRRFQQTGGRPRPGVQDLLLTTRGRRSGMLRRTALVYVGHGAGWAVVASNGGAATHPAWYLNLLAHPDVVVETADGTSAARARAAEAGERPALWAAFAAADPAYLRYAAATRREIPVVVLEPDRQPDRAVPADGGDTSRATHRDPGRY